MTKVHPYRVVLFTAFVVCTVLVLPRLQTVAFALFLTVVFSLVLDAPVSALVRRGMPRPGAVGVVVAAFAAFLTGGFALLVPAVIQEFRSLVEQRGGLTEEIVARLNEVRERLSVPVPELQAEDFTGDRVIEMLNRLHIFESTGAVLGIVVFSLFAAIWAVGSPEPLQQRLLAFVVPRRREQVATIARAVEERLRRWLLGQLVLNLYVGVGTYVLFRSLGVPFAAVWAIAAAFLEMIPTAGAILSAVGPALLLLLDDPGKIVWLVIGILVIQQFEDRFVVPTVMRKALDIPQTLLVFAMLTFGVLFGPGGLVMAVPIVAALITIHDEVMAYDQVHATNAAAEEAVAAEAPLPEAEAPEAPETPNVAAETLPGQRSGDEGRSPKADPVPEA